MRNKRQRRRLIYLVLTILILIGVFIVFNKYLKPKNNQPVYNSGLKSAIQLSDASYADFKSKDGAFSFKYPKEWFLINISDLPKTILKDNVLLKNYHAEILFAALKDPLSQSQTSVAAISYLFPASLNKQQVLNLLLKDSYNYDIKTLGSDFAQDDKAIVENIYILQDNSEIKIHSKEVLLFQNIDSKQQAVFELSVLCQDKEWSDYKSLFTTIGNSAILNH